MTVKARPPLYLLVEETSRELNSRILLATVGAQTGFRSLIIPQWFAWEHFDLLPRGIVLFKGNNAAQSSRMLSARKAGHHVAAVEEEILGVIDPPEILRFFQSDHADACEMFLLQGAHARDIVADRHPDLAGRMVVTGNPRTDLLRRPFDGPIRREAEAIRERFGDYILVNTNYGATNPATEDTVAFRALCVRVGVLDPANQQDCDEFIARCEWERDNLALMARVIARCVRSPSLPRIIIRPHPAENIGKWREAYADVPGVSVIREGDHVPWTAAARLLLHTGCTTGVEAALLGTPVLSLKGGRSHWHRYMTANLVNPVADDEDEAMHLIERVFAGDREAATPSPGMWRELQRQLLPNAERSAAQAIIEALGGLTASEEPAGPGFDTLSRIAGHKVAFSDNKIDPGQFNRDSISEISARYARDLGLTRPPAVDRIGDAVISISPPGDSRDGFTSAG